MEYPFEDRGANLRPEVNAEEEEEEERVNHKENFTRGCLFVNYTGFNKALELSLAAKIRLFLCLI